ncbi:MAG: O-antigen ligase family protein [Pseudomonadota bacterium]
MTATAAARGGLGVADRARVAAILFCFALVPVAAALMHRAFAPILLTIGAVAATRAAFWSHDLAGFFGRPAWRTPLTIAAVAALVFVALIAARGAPGLALVAAAPIGASVAAVAYLRAVPAAAAGLARAFCVAVAAAVILLTIEYLTDGWLRAATPPTDETPGRWKDFVALARGVTAAAPCLFPAVAAGAAFLSGRQRRRLLAFGALAALLIPAAAFGVFSNVVALAAGALAACAALKAPRTTITVLTVGFVVATLAAPAAVFIPAEALNAAHGATWPASWTQRLFVWNAAAEAAVRCLPFGCGPDYARAMAAAGATVSVEAAAIALPVMPTHPHNVFLQIWLELGAPGAAAFAAALAAGGLALRRAAPSPVVAAGIVGSAAFALASFSLEASLWQAWRSSAFGLAAIGNCLSYLVNRRVNTMRG